MSLSKRSCPSCSTWKLCSISGAQTPSASVPTVSWDINGNLKSDKIRFTFSFFLLWDQKELKKTELFFFLFSKKGTFENFKVIRMYYEFTLKRYDILMQGWGFGRIRWFLASRIQIHYLFLLDPDPTCNKRFGKLFLSSTKFKPDSTNSSLKWWFIRSNFMPTYFKYKYIFSSLRIKVGSGSKKKSWILIPDILTD